jgi:CheY-like chemotaxis protein
VRRHPLDLVLLDCQMPEMDGYETASRMRALPEGRRLRIVAVTAHAQPGERERCISAGMDDYLSKPVTMDALRRVLTEAQSAASKQR